MQYELKGKKTPVDSQRMKTLNQRAEKSGKTISCILGVAGTVAFTAGLILMIALGVWQMGLIATSFGAAAMIASWPIYQMLSNRARARIAAQMNAPNREADPAQKEFSH